MHVFPADSGVCSLVRCPLTRVGAELDYLCIGIWCEGFDLYLVACRRRLPFFLACRSVAVGLFVSCHFCKFTCRSSTAYIIGIWCVQFWFWLLLLLSAANGMILFVVVCGIGIWMVLLRRCGPMSELDHLYYRDLVCVVLLLLGVCSCRRCLAELLVMWFVVLECSQCFFCYMGEQRSSTTYM